MWFTESGKHKMLKVLEKEVSFLCLRCGVGKASADFARRYFHLQLQAKYGRSPVVRPPCSRDTHIDMALKASPTYH
jgi:hypothetical protein